MARPTKTEQERKTLHLSFRLTPAERLQVEQAANNAGLTASEYARQQTLKGRVIVQQTHSLTHDVFDQLRRIGVNLNQITKIANRKQNIPSELSQVCTKLEEILIQEIERHGP